jgi:hypothetical protein
MRGVKMDLYKLKIDKYQVKKAVNFPDALEISFEKMTGQTQVILYYIEKLSDVQKMIDCVKKENMAKDNRVIVVYKKGRKDEVTRDNIHTFFVDKNVAFKNRAPMLCALSKELSAFCKSYER